MRPSVLQAPKGVLKWVVQVSQVANGLRWSIHGQGAKGGPKSGPSAKLRTGIGKSKSVMTTKILALTDALDNLGRFLLPTGHRFVTVSVAGLIEGVTFNALLADKVFD